MELTEAIWMLSTTAVTYYWIYKLTELHNNKKK